MKISNSTNSFQILGNSKLFKECNLLENDYFPNTKTCFQASSFAPFCQEEKYLCSIWIQKQKNDSFFDTSLMLNFLRSFPYENMESMLYTKKPNDPDFNDYLPKFCSLISWQILKISFYCQLRNEKKFEIDEGKDVIRKNYADIFNETKFFEDYDRSIDMVDYVLNENVFYIKEDKEEEIL